MTRPSGLRPPCPEDGAEAAKTCPLGDLGWGPRLPLWSAPVLTWGTVLPAFGASCVRGGALTLVCWVGPGVWVMTPSCLIPGVAPLPTQCPGTSGLPCPRTVGLGRTPLTSHRQAAPLPLFFSHAPVTSGQGGLAQDTCPSQDGWWCQAPGCVPCAPGSGLCSVCWGWWHLEGGLRLQEQISAPRCAGLYPPPPRRR